MNDCSCPLGPIVVLALTMIDGAQVRLYRPAPVAVAWMTADFGLDSEFVRGDSVTRARIEWGDVDSRGWDTSV